MGIAGELKKPYGESLAKGSGWCQSWVDNHKLVQGWSANSELLVLYNAARIATGDVLEIGCFLGRSTVQLAAGLKISGRSGTVHAIDPFFDPFKVTYDDPNWRSWWVDNFPQNGDVITGTKNVFLGNVKKCQVDDKISVHHSLSRDIHGAFQNESLGVLFIDGNHDYEHVKEDFTLYFPKVAKGGLVLFHDVIPSHPGVVRFIKELEADKNNGLESIAHITSLGIYQKVARK